jgi:hypothetical protein
MNAAKTGEAIEVRWETIASTQKPTGITRGHFRLAKPGDNRFRGVSLEAISRSLPAKTPWIVQVADDEFVLTTSFVGDALTLEEGVRVSRLTRVRLRGVTDEEVGRWMAEIQKFQSRCFHERVWTLEAGLAYLGRINDGRRIAVGNPAGGAQKVFLSVMAIAASAARNHLFQYGVDIRLPLGGCR